MVPSRPTHVSPATSRSVCSQQRRSPAATFWQGRLYKYKMAALLTFCACIAGYPALWAVQWARGFYDRLVGSKSAGKKNSGGSIKEKKAKKEQDTKAAGQQPKKTAAKTTKKN